MTEPAPKLKWGEVTAAAFVGFVFEWLCITIFILGNLHGSPSAWAYVLVFAGLPALFALLLVPHRRRLQGASFLIGLLLGSITGAGICAGFWASGG